ncbi:MAG: TonB-dependent receptor [Bacteroidetes bacterium]|nr:TonB-dependent receptor [Bacteroidota bacterium]MBL7104751.1 TonB-dependent receptor [Bacteroidales bacterium]
MKKVLFLFVAVIISGIITAQDKHTLSGHIKDATTGEELIGASIFVKELKTGGITNVYGFYSITIPRGKYIIEYRFIGYETQSTKINLVENIKQDIELSPSSTSLEEVIVSAEAVDENIKSTEMGIVKLNVKEIKSIPVIFGEQDILKIIQLMPGVSSSGEGNSGYYVRGGGTDQNLILLDEAPVYNAGHLMGFFSVFNSDAIKDVKLYKGNAPAEYGGRLSSVLDLKMNDGNSKRFGVSGGLGLIASRLTIDGPIIKDKSSFIISGRRTYADLFLNLSSDEVLKDAKLYFYDLNMKANYRFGANDRIFISGYFGRDVLFFGKSEGTNWGNSTFTLRWNHIFNNKLFLNTSLIYSNYDYEVKVGEATTVPDISAAIRDYNLKQDFQYFLTTNNTLKFGFKINHHTFKPGEVTATETNYMNFKKIEDKYALENAVYASHEINVSGRLTFIYGLRYSMFFVLGPGSIYSFDADGEITDTTTYTSGEIIKNYGGFEPRFTINYLLNETSSCKMSYSRNRQYIHLLSIATSGTPIDQWQPSTPIIKPEISDQLALGYFKNFADNKFETSVEVYYKYLQNQIEYKNGAEILMNEKFETQLVFGEGQAYGIEFLIKKKFGKLTGWISYTLSRSERKFDKINNGDVFPARQDRTHDISIVGIYQPTGRWIFSATWVYNTGNAITFPSGKYLIDDHIANYYTERNGYRMPAYHRLDLSITFLNKKRKRFESSWNISAYNAYARKNAYSINFQKNENNPAETQAVMRYLYTIVPSITYNFKF